MPVQIIDLVVERLRTVAGVEALVLGGSRARGTHHAESDIDIGIYYRSDLDVAALQSHAQALDDLQREQLVTEIGGWGPWINGGGWLTIQAMPVDWLYRDLNKVEQVLAACQAGQVTIDYQPGHPHGFVSAMYLAEVALCQPLYDPYSSLANLKQQLHAYPPTLQEALIGRFWEADFALANARKAVKHGDSAYIAGCCFRSVMVMTQTLFALNQQYWMNEKGSVALTRGFKHVPAAYDQQVARIFSLLQPQPESIAQALDELERLIRATAALLD
ncbi:nucleotidyltransferase domain-containing protein [Herpetosiphon llansteffanensis]|uniref:nucleotidyltransferase domain-containing protein n=1 Tax=Herpetosiphon llansteffanensis TaxID=2094568 RepID=UPI000D7BA65B|nr:nucleotidyltransferase domain-containing protein [Herpetosiphon llansteffanensis]